ncbi:fatty acid omega-hydroxylase [Spatholobus suberectus]|nr:fatty acid omega-hydroxylase [Spatholobus suberectus]
MIDLQDMFEDSPSTRCSSVEDKKDVQHQLGEGVEGSDEVGARFNGDYNNEEKRNDVEKGETDLLMQLLEVGHEEMVVKDMVISMIMVGRDTTSVAMMWLFWLLSKHREEEALIVREVCGCGDQSQSEGLDYECLKEMKLLKACLCESMRLYPASGIGLEAHLWC